MILQSVRYPVINTRFAAPASSSADKLGLRLRMLPLRRTQPRQGSMPGRAGIYRVVARAVNKLSRNQSARAFIKYHAHARKLHDQIARFSDRQISCSVSVTALDRIYLWWRRPYRWWTPFNGVIEWIMQYYFDDIHLIQPVPLHSHACGAYCSTALRNTPLPSIYTHATYSLKSQTGSALAAPASCAALQPKARKPGGLAGVSTSFAVTVMAELVAKVDHCPGDLFVGRAWNVAIEALITFPSLTTPTEAGACSELMNHRSRRWRCRRRERTILVAWSPPSPLLRRASSASSSCRAAGRPVSRAQLTSTSRDRAGGDVDATNGCGSVLWSPTADRRRPARDEGRAAPSVRCSGTAEPARE